MKFKEYLDEELKIIKMNLPKTSKEFNLFWNDKFDSNHDMFSRIKRTKLNRKEAIKTIISGIDSVSEELKKNDGMYIIDFKESKFFLSVYMEKDFKTLNIKTILDYDMLLRVRDVRLSVNEAETLFDIDLSEFYKNGFINGYYGSLFIEENIPRTELDIFLDRVLDYK